MATPTSFVDILVYAAWQQHAGDIFMGTLKVERLRGKEIFSFTYDKAWLNSQDALLLDPDLAWFDGPQYNRDAKPNFGLFTDSAPDRWGRVLMQRREALIAKKENRKARPLLEADYLLGVSDKNRMGALRFKTSPDGPFLDDNDGLAAPPFTSLRSLEQASLQLEQADDFAAAEAIQWLNMLMAPGSSLGGARPKASVMDTGGQLWIAKFPSKQDTRDTGGWEAVAAVLASKAGITMAEGVPRRFTTDYHTYLTRRFDRDKDKRIHFASAMTLLGKTDGADAAAGVSYLDLAEIIVRQGASPQADLEELWRRMVFNIAISNSDDHLRNHGFLLTTRGWKLSPAFDINPIPQATGLSLNVNETSNALDMDLAFEVSEQFRVSEPRALEIVETVLEAVSHWHECAKRIGIAKKEMLEMEQAFMK